MEYHFLCDDCQTVNVVSRPMAQAGEPAWCPVCSEEMQRMFFAPKLMNREKPRSYSFDRGNPNGWDSRLAALRLAEANGETQVSLKEKFGKAYDMTLAYKKKKYG